MHSPERVPPPDASPDVLTTSRIRELLRDWMSAAEDPVVAHDAVLRLTYGVTAAVAVLALLARLVGMVIPTWLLLSLAATLLAATRVQQQLLRRARYMGWMPLLHLNLSLVLLSVGIAYTGGLRSPFVWTYAIPVAVEGVLRGGPWGIISATASTVYLVAATFAATSGLVGRPFLEEPGFSAFLISYVGMFYVVAFIASALREQVRDIFRLARTDPLTGLANRYALRLSLEREVARARRYGLECALIVVEIDQFKRFNDRYGHLHGDEVLRRVSATLRGSCRAADLPARFGGDEFVVVLPQTGKGEATRVAERIRGDMEEFSLLRGFGLTVSVGVAAFPDDGLSARDLLEAADTAMYAAKSGGGNAVAVAAGTHPAP
jgi:diguanylate cyclase (GGDEF)-like protein